MAATFAGVSGAGLLDFVSAWYRKAADYMADNPTIKAAFVSTNSITQGEQVGVLWPDLLKRGVKIHFAHRTFQWSSEARGKAAVHCVIIGFALHEAEEKRIFNYETPQAEPHEVKAKNINPYLVDAPDTFLPNRTSSISDAPEITFGNMPNDGGFLLLTDDKKKDLLKIEPLAQKFVFPFFSAKEFLNDEKRWCLWLADITTQELRDLPEIKVRVANIKKLRESSERKTTRELAKFPTRFGEIRQPESDYILIPRHSSENRSYIPLGFLKKSDIVADSCLAVRNAKLFHFGVLSSAMHMVWTRTVCGRLESRYRYSAGIVYNNFPWPQAQTDKQKQAIEDAAQAVLDARAKFPNASLADLYDPLTMPEALTKAHQKLDAAVDSAYAKRKFTGDTDRVAFLFELYQQITSPLESKKATRRKRVKP